MEWLSDHKIPVGTWAEDFFLWLQDNAAGFFDALAILMETLIDAFLWVLQTPHPLVIIAVFVGLTWALQRNWKTCLFVALGFLFILNQGYWEETTESLTLVLSSCIFCMAIGVPIGIAALRTGYWLLGIDRHAPHHRSLFEQFGYAGTDLWDNLCAWLLGEPTNWSNLHIFYDKVFYPYMIGGILPGIITGLVAYYLTVPVIRAYQSRRRGALNAKLAALKAKKARERGSPPN